MQCIYKIHNKYNVYYLHPSGKYLEVPCRNYILYVHGQVFTLYLSFPLLFSVKLLKLCQLAK